MAENFIRIHNEGKADIETQLQDSRKQQATENRLRYACNLFFIRA